METINGKALDKLTHADWTAIEQRREAERLRDNLQHQIDRCRRYLDEAERDLKRTDYAFTRSSGVLGSTAVELDTLAATYSVVQGLAARMINSLEHDHRVANPGPGEGLVAFFKFVRVEGCGLQALPSIRVYTYREPNKTRRHWAVAVEDTVLLDRLNLEQAKARAQRAANELGGLEVVVEG